MGWLGARAPIEVPEVPTAIDVDRSSLAQRRLGGDALPETLANTAGTSAFNTPLVCVARRDRRPLGPALRPGLGKALVAPDQRGA